MSRSRLLLAVMLLWAASAEAKELRALRTSAAGADALRWVVVAEGYREVDREAFFDDAKTLLEGVFAADPYAFVGPMIAASALFVASPARGADHPETGEKVDTAFDATYGAQGVARLLVADDSKVILAVSEAKPDYDLAIVLVNDAAYGGSGGAVPVVSLHPSAVAILRHELGHTVGGLADTYEAPYPGYPPGDPEPNVSSAEHLAALKWQAWVPAATPIPTPITAQTGPHAPIGAYEGARYLKQGMFRPAPTCIMRDLAVGWCPVCNEAMIAAVLQETFVARTALPAPGDVVCGPSQCPQLQLLVTPHPAATVRWWLEGIPMAPGPTLSLATPEKAVLVRAEATVDSAALSDPIAKGLRIERSWTLRPPPSNGEPTDAEADGAATLDAGPDAGSGDWTPVEPRLDAGCTAAQPAPSSQPLHAIWLLLLSMAAIVRRRGTRRRT